MVAAACSSTPQFGTGILSFEDGDERE